MSHAVQPPVGAPPPPSQPASPRRPVPVTLAAAVLALMALVGLAYAIATIVVAPGTADRFRGAAVGAVSTDVDGYVSVIWLGAAVGTVLAVILFALYVVLALGLRQGSNAARIATWVVCAVGLLAGCGATVTVLVERSGAGDPQSLGAALSGAYPGPWIRLNLTLAIGQMVGYVVVALLLLGAGGRFFGKGATPAAPHPQGQQYGYGYDAPYGQSLPPGYPPAGQGYGSAGDQAYQPGAGQGYVQSPPPTGGWGQPPPATAAQPPGQPFGVPPMHPGSMPAHPSAPQPRPHRSGPDDEYWSRPPS